MGARLARWARPPRAPIINYSVGGTEAVGGGLGRGGPRPALRPRSARPPPARYARGAPALAPCGARPPLRFGRGIHWRYLRYSKFSRAILAREATSREN